MNAEGLMSAETSPTPARPLAGGNVQVCRLWLTVLACVLTSPPSLCAQDASEPDLRALRQVRVPVGELQQRVPEAWRAVSSHDLDALLQTVTEEQGAPPEAEIVKAVYRGSIVDDVCRGGEFAASVVRTTDQLAILRLAPLNLALSNLSWSDAAAAWGSSAEGRVSVLVDRDHESLTGTWTVRGQRRSHRIEFDLQFPQATVSELELRVPSHLQISATPGVVTERPAAADAKWVNWNVELGRETDCRVTVSERRQLQPPDPILLVKQATVYSVRDEGLRVQADFQIDVRHGPVHSVDVHVPPELTVYAITYGAETPLAWRELAADEYPGDGVGTWLRVQLPDPLQGPMRRLRFLAVGKVQINESWELPQLSLPAGVFLGGELQLDVTRPLETRLLEIQGGYQTHAVMDAASHESMTFQQFVRSGRLNVIIGYPDLELSGAVVTNVDIRGSDWQAKAQVSWRAKGGSQFVVQCRVAPGWNVSDASSHPSLPPVDVVYWDFRPRTDDWSLLTVEFASALVSERPHSLLLQLQRVPGIAARRLQLPLLEPVGCHDLQTAIAVRGIAEADNIPADDLGGFRRTAIELLPPFARDSIALADLHDQMDDVLFLHGDTPTAQQPIEIPTGADTLSARADVQIDVAADTIRERFDVRVRPHGEIMRNVHVYFANSGTGIEWSLEDQTGVLPSSRRPINQHPAFGLPPIGELWAIELPREFNGPVTLHGTRTQGFDLNVTAALPYVPLTQTFDGRVNVAESDNTALPVEFVKQGLRVAPAARGSDSLEASSRWVYTRHGAILQLRRERLSTAPAVATLQLRSQIFIDDNAQDVHWCRYQVRPGARQDEFKFRLASSAEFIEARVNGIAVRPARQNDRFTLSGLNPDQDNLIEIQYWTPSDGSQIVSRRQVALPQTDCTTVDFDWQFALPKHVVAVESPAQLQLLTLASPVSWTRRLFGPLGRSSQATPFDPFDASSWRTALLPDAERIENPTVEGWEFGSMGWSVWEAVADRQPARIQLEIVNRSQVYICAWIMLLSTVVVGFGLRLLRLRGRTVVGTLWLTLSLLAAWTLPPLYAEIAGGAISGWIIACLVPRQLLFRLRSTPPPKDASTQLLTPSNCARGAGVVGVCLWAVLQASGAFGQLSRELSALTLQDVIVPVSDENDAEDVPIRYVHEDVLAALRGRARDARGEDYFFSRAQYTCAVRGTTTTLRAELRVSVLSSRKTVDVFLPIAGANLGGETACRVNGRPHPILPARSRPGFILQLHPRATSSVIEPQTLQTTERAPAAESATVGEQALATSHPGSPFPQDAVRPLEVFEVSLELYPPTLPIPGGGRIDVRIPRIPDSSVQVALDREYAAVDIPGIPESAAEPSTAAARAVTLGMRDRLQLSWSTQSDGQGDAAELRAECQGVVVATPTALEYHYRLICEPVQGTVDALRLQFPAGLEQLEVDGADVQSVTLQSEQAVSLVLLEFAEPLEGVSVVKLAFLIPQKQSRLLLQLPAVNPFADDPRVQQVQNVLGVVAAPAFTLESMEIDGDRVSRVASGVTVDNLRAEMAFQLQSPSQLSFRLVPKIPRRQVFQNLEGVVEADRIQWRLSAEIKTETTPAFSHELVLDPRLTIESVSVREDGAERLVRWNRDGTRLTLFLSRRTTGLQNLELNASQPHQMNEQVTLPEIRFADAELVESQLTLWHRSALEAQLQGPPGLDRGDARPPAADTPGEEWMGRWDILPFAAESLSIRPYNERTDFRFDQLLVLSPDDGRQWKLTAHLKLRADLEWLRTLQVLIPDALTGEMELDAQGGQAELGPYDAGRRSVRVDLDEEAKSATSSVTLSTYVEIPYDSTWAVPQFQVEGLAPDQIFVVLDRDPEAPVTGPSENLIASDQLPEWCQSALPDDGDDPQWKAYRFAAGDLSLIRQPLDRRIATGADVVLIETDVWVRGVRRLSGRTTIYPLVLRDTPDLTLDWSERIWLRAVTVNGQPFSVVPENGQLKLELRRLEHPVHVVQLFWEQEQELDGILFRNMVFTVPTIAGDAEHASLLRVVPSSTFALGLRDLRTLRGDEFLPERIDALLDLCRQQARYGAADQTSWRILEAAEKAATQSLSQLKPERESDLELEELRRRLAQVREEMRELSEFFAELPAGNEDVMGLLPVAESPRSITVALPSSNSVEVCEAWVVEHRRFKLVVGLLTLPLALAVIGRLVRKKTGAWLNQHQAVSWLLFGLVWWSCLTPSILGLVFVMVGIVYLFRRSGEPAYASSLIIQ